MTMDCVQADSRFAPDSGCVAAVVPSPNHGVRRAGAVVDHLILHYTGMPSGEAALRWLCDPASQVSCHYFVEEDGRVLQLVPEARRAWHAGHGAWAGETDINSRSLGIEIVNAGHPGGLPAFPTPQVAALVALCRDLLARNPISPKNVLAHSDVAPRRKIDPGERFPWRVLHEAGIGRWVAPAPIEGKGCAEPAASTETRVLLGRYGYLTGDAEDGEALAFAVKAFQRHFRPARVDGILDTSTLDTLRRLAALRA